MSIFSRLFGKTEATPSAEPHIIVAKFGEVLETRAPGFGTVADVQELPYSKNQIKIAILLMLKVTSDTQLREHLKTGYISLASWQVGVGPKHLGLDAMKLDTSQDISVLAKQVLAGGEEMKKWQPIVEAEEEALIGELRKLGFW